jgi:alkylation response protein AidB-like acyl-CoA dehydrogenase
VSAARTGPDVSIEPTQASVTAWLRENWSTDITLREWWSRLARSGLGFPTWPEGLGGRGWDRASTRVVSSAFGVVSAIGAPTGLGTLMGGPVVLQFGSAEQQARLLPRLVNGTEGWCQLFSEPGAGSDLASVSTKAESDGDEWIVNGQKVWTSGSTHSARGMLVARTDIDAPKHRGMSYFIIDMHQPGVEIRPLKQMNGQSHFSEVFFTDARVSDSNRISDVNNGWAVTVATLGFERSGLSAVDGTPGVRPPAGELAGFLDREVGEVIAAAKSARTLPEDTGGTFSMLRQLSEEFVRDRDPMVRQALARRYSHERIATLMQQRAAANARAGRSAGPEASLAKLHWTVGLTQGRDVGTAILGAHGMLHGPDSASNGVVQKYALTIPSARIAGGSDEIQRNIIGERVLGLPKDIVVDADIPFRHLKKS